MVAEHDHRPFLNSPADIFVFLVRESIAIGSFQIHLISPWGFQNQGHWDGMTGFDAVSATFRAFFLQVDEHGPSLGLQGFGACMGLPLPRRRGRPEQVSPRSPAGKARNFQECPPGALHPFNSWGTTWQLQHPGFTPRSYGTGHRIDPCSNGNTGMYRKGSSGISFRRRRHKPTFPHGPPPASRY